MTKRERSQVEIDSEIIKLCLDMILVCRPERSQRERAVAEQTLNDLLDHLIDLVARLNG